MVFFMYLIGRTKCVFRVYGFFDECTRKYDQKLWYMFQVSGADFCNKVTVYSNTNLHYLDCTQTAQVNIQEVFNSMPFAGLVANRIFCMHGGIPKDMKTFDCIRKFTTKRPVDPSNPVQVKLVVVGVTEIMIM